MLFGLVVALAVTIGAAPVTATAIAAPTNLVAHPVIDGAIITFTSGDGGSVTNHEYSLDNGSTWTAFHPPQASSPVLVDGLSGQSSIQLRALTATATSAASTAVTVTPRSQESFGNIGVEFWIAFLDNANTASTGP